MRCTFGVMWEYTDRQTDSIIKPKETKAYLTHLTMKWYSTESEIPKHQGSSVKKISDACFNTPCSETVKIT